MGYQPVPGHPVALISPDGADLLASGTIAGTDGIVVHVDCDARSQPLPHGDLLIVTGTPGAGHMAYASVVSVAGTTATLALLLEFRDVLDRRRTLRDQPAFPSQCGRRTATRSPAACWTSRAMGPPSSREPGFELGSMLLDWNDMRIEVSASVTGREEGWQGILLHCRFMDLDDERPALIDTILADLTRKHDHAQQLLVARPANESAPY